MTAEKKTVWINILYPADWKKYKECVKLPTEPAYKIKPHKSKLPKFPLTGDIELHAFFDTPCDVGKTITIDEAKNIILDSWINAGLFTSRSQVVSFRAHAVVDGLIDCFDFRSMRLAVRYTPE